MLSRRMSRRHRKTQRRSKIRRRSSRRKSSRRRIFKRHRRRSSRRKGAYSKIRQFLRPPVPPPVSPTTNDDVQNTKTLEAENAMVSKVVSNTITHVSSHMKNFRNIPYPKMSLASRLSLQKLKQLLLHNISLPATVSVSSSRIAKSAHDWLVRNGLFGDHEPGRIPYILQTTYGLQFVLLKNPIGGNVREEHIDQKILTQTDNMRRDCAAMITYILAVVFKAFFVHAPLALVAFLLLRSSMLALNSLTFTDIILVGSREQTGLMTKSEAQARHAESQKTHQYIAGVTYIFQQFDPKKIDEETLKTEICPRAKNMMTSLTDLVYSNSSNPHIFEFAQESAAFCDMLQSGEMSSEMAVSVLKKVKEATQCIRYAPIKYNRIKQHYNPYMLSIEDHSSATNKNGTDLSEFEDHSSATNKNGTDLSEFEIYIPFLDETCMAKLGMNSFGDALSQLTTVSNEEDDNINKPSQLDGVVTTVPNKEDDKINKPSQLDGVVTTVPNKEDDKINKTAERLIRSQVNAQASSYLEYAYYGVMSGGATLIVFLAVLISQTFAPAMYF
jgi:hypothetical protein